MDNKIAKAYEDLQKEIIYAAKYSTQEDAMYHIMLINDLRRDFEKTLIKMGILQPY